MTQSTSLRFFNAEPVVSERVDPLTHNAYPPGRLKDQIRKELQADMEAWLAQGNQISVAPPTFNCPNSRKVQITDPSYFQ